MSFVGWPVGAGDGFSVFFVGSGVGLCVCGFFVGSGVGLCVCGFFVGSGVGDGVGRCVWCWCGRGVGECVRGRLDGSGVGVSAGGSYGLWPPHARQHALMPVIPFSVCVDPVNLQASAWGPQVPDASNHAMSAISLHECS